MSMHKFLPGLGLLSSIAVAAVVLSERAHLSAWGASPLTLAILAGIALGNLRPAWTSGIWQPGIRWAQTRLLRLGVALYGFNLGVAQIATVGWRGFLLALLMLATTLALGCWIGRRVLGMETDAALLVAAGSAICGAAAVVATASMLAMDEATRLGKTTTAVAAVVLFGTLAMFLYPLLFAVLGLPSASFGVFVGASVHEVAQVVAIGNAIGPETAHTAVIVKMIRVLLLLPFLLGLGIWQARRSAAGVGTSMARRLVVPWFALGFLACVAIHSLGVLPSAGVQALRDAATGCLGLAMAAFGMETRLLLLRRAGVKPLLLGAFLFVHLLLVGGALSFLIAR
jgi:uncharacterized integral membrane protein (TIGR00698 family)